MSWRLPFGFSFADGETQIPNQPLGQSGSGLVGTPDPTGDIQVFGNNSGVDANGNPIKIQQSDGSPEVERAEQATFQSRLKTTWEACKSFMYVLGRGTFVTDENGNIWRVLSSKIQRLRGGFGELSVTGESISFDSPPDDYQMTPVELGINIIMLNGFHHRKLAMIDRNILWEGSLNILSQTKSLEIMRRMENKELTEQMLKFLSISDYL